MAEKWKNTYRIESARWQNWDYTWDGTYFITICTENHQHYFGKIHKHRMVLSPAGILADVFWHQIPIFSPHVQLGEFVVMPNHIHGILILDSLTSEEYTVPSGKTIAKQRQFNNDGRSVSSILGHYKGAVTKHSKRLGFDMKWQSRFYDRVIRSQKEHQRIATYISRNIEKWGDDCYFSM
ncbi:MAG: transposase [Bacteroidota bacterium]